MKDNRRQRDAASVFKSTVRLAASQKLHIDVLVWDERGRTHLDRLRDTPGNRETMHLQLMYRFLFSRVITRWRSADPTVIPHWTFAPDRQEGVDFDAVEMELNLDPTLPGGALANVVNVKSALNYSLQLADLLAGLVAWSHQNSDVYETWLRLGKRPDLQLPATQWRNRFPLLEHFSQLCKVYDLGPTMLSPIPAFPGRGLWTQETGLTHHTIDLQPFTPLP